jgi:hypothetical protein
MTVEEKIIEQLKKYDNGDCDWKDLPRFLTVICQQEIKDACDKQKEICAEVGRKANVRNETSVYQFIIDSPYPEGVE